MTTSRTDLLVQLGSDPRLWDLRSVALATEDPATAAILADLCEERGQIDLAAEWREQAREWAAREIARAIRAEAEGFEVSPPGQVPITLTRRAGEPR